MAGNTTNNPTYTFSTTTPYVKGAIAVISVNNNVVSGIPIPFLINPESISESLTGGWIHKSVPGQNDPISSWVGNGARTVILSLLIINDISFFNNQTQAGIANTTQKNILSTLGATVANIKIPILQGTQPNQPALNTSTTQTLNDLNISQQLDQLRQLRYASLDPNNLYSVAPSLIKFHFDASPYSGSNTVSNPTLGIGANSLGNVYWTVDAIEINTIKWSSNLQPLEAEVKLTLVQFNDVNQTRTSVFGTGNAGGNVPFTPTA